MRPYRLPPPFLKLHPSRPRAVPTSNQSAVHTCATGPGMPHQQVLKALHRLAREQIECVPSLSIELNELTAAFCRLLGLCTFCRHQVVISPLCLRGPISSSVTSKENSTCSASNAPNALAKAATAFAGSSKNMAARQT